LLLRSRLLWLSWLLSRLLGRALVEAAPATPVISTVLGSGWLGL